MEKKSHLADVLSMFANEIHRQKPTPRFLIALFRSFTTSMPSTPLALNFFVHVNKTA